MTYQSLNFCLKALDVQSQNNNSQQFMSFVRVKLENV